MLNRDLLATTAIGDLTIYYAPKCRPRILIVTDGGLSFTTDGFGLSRFVDALSKASPKPLITLAYRGAHTSPVNLHGTNYPVLNNFNFATAATAVTTANYDQIWLFGIVSGPAISNLEVRKIGEFMNAGGGVFATGDHATLGKAMSGQLPRIRHMREWTTIPMGTEGNPNARNRIDTVVNPGADGLYQFIDQSDDIPQRIYPNYKVTWAGSNWTARIHPLLRLPGSPDPRTNASGFTNDMDVMPDHPHESVCYEVSASVNAGALNGAYNLAGLNFQEFPNAVAGGGRIGSEIVAFAVSGGRSVENGPWKPPVNPRMFGIISGFDGHAAASYAGAPTRPGRIVCDSTWHHYVNVNLDGTGTGRAGLRILVNGNLIPSPDLEKIYTYYRNILSWLQPLNRIYCWLIYDLVAVRFNPLLIEELIEAPQFDNPLQFEGLGLEAMRLIDRARGPGAAAEAIQAAIRSEGSAASIVDRDVDGEDEGEPCDCGRDRRIAFVLGKALAYLATSVALDQAEQVGKQLGGDREHDRLERGLAQAVARAAEEAVGIEAARSERKLRRLATLTAKPTRPK